MNQRSDYLTATVIEQFCWTILDSDWWQF